MTRRKAPADATDDITDDDDGSPAGGSDNDGGAGGDGGDTGGDDLESHIRRVVTEVVGKVLGDGPAGDAPAGGRTTQAQDEGAIRRMVREAQDTLRKEEEKDARFSSVAETVESLKKAVEKPPARAGLAGRVGRFMWGEDD